MSTVVIELTVASIRCLQVDAHGHTPRLRQFLIEPLRSGEAVEEGVSRLVKLLGARPGSVISTIPRDQILTRIMKLPATRLSDVTQMVTLAGTTRFPYPPGTVVMTSQVVEQQAGSTTVQLVACHRDLIEQHLALLRRAGIEPTVITSSSWGVLSWYRQCGRSPDLPDPVLVINVDACQTDLVLIRAQRIVFSRLLNDGVQEWQAGLDGCERLLQEIQRSLASARQEWSGMDVQAFVLTGLGPLEEWQDVFEQRLGRPVSVRDAQGALPFSSLPKGAAISPAVVAGLAMAEREWLVNLLPPEVQRIQQRQRRLSELLPTCALLLLACWLGVGLLVVRVSRQVRAVAQTNQTLHKLEAMTERASQKEHALHFIERVLADRREAAEMLAELLRITPENIVFAHLTFERSRGELVVGGSAATTRQVLEYLRQLEASDHWERAELRYSTSRWARTQRRAAFEIVLRQKVSS